MGHAIKENSILGWPNSSSTYNGKGELNCIDKFLHFLKFKWI